MSEKLSTPAAKIPSELGNFNFNEKLTTIHSPQFVATSLTLSLFAILLPSFLSDSVLKFPVPTVPRFDSVNSVNLLGPLGPQCLQL